MKRSYVLSFIALIVLHFEGCYTESSTIIPCDSDSETETDTDTETDEGNDEDVFISRWVPDATGIVNDRYITLPLVETGEYDFVVDWGDGAEDKITSWDDKAKTHEYDDLEMYELRITGLIKGWSFLEAWLEDSSEGYSPMYGSEVGKIVEITNWGPLEFGDTSGQFHCCSNLTISATDSPGLEDTTSLYRAFHGCSSITEIPSITAWDTSEITDMGQMFIFMTLFNQDLSDLDTSSVTNMSGMLSYTSAFNGDISGWDTSSVIDMSEMFEGSDVFNQDLTSWDTSNVENMSDMFSHTDSFNGDILSWDTSSVTNMERMFGSAEAFNSDLDSWNTSNVTNMNFMFGHAPLFNQDLPSWDTSSVITMVRMFKGAASFNGDITEWNTSSVVDMEGMFYDAVSFDQNLSNWNVTSIVYNSSQDGLLHMFENVGLSTANYDALLIGWASQDVNHGIYFDAGHSTYSLGEAAEARQQLMLEHGWIIEDGGQASQ